MYQRIMSCLLETPSSDMFTYWYICLCIFPICVYFLHLLCINVLLDVNQADRDE